jgi:cytidine deaminase
MDELFAAADLARANAHAPYSRFPVGAALRTDTGRVFAGANVECASFPEGWCAETSALGAMVAAGEWQVVEVLVIADHAEPITPCGGCRQRLAEFATATTIVRAADSRGERARWTLGELLPAAFGLRP